MGFPWSQGRGGKHIGDTAPKTRLIDHAGAPVSPAAWLVEVKQHIRIAADTRTAPELGALLDAAYTAVQNAIGFQLVTGDFQEFILPNGNAPIALCRRPFHFGDVAPTLRARDISDPLTAVPYDTLGDHGEGKWRIDDHSRLFIDAEYLRGYELDLRYQAGEYGNADQLPEEIKRAIYMTTAHLYENRGDAIAPPNWHGIPYPAMAVLKPHIRHATVISGK